MKALKVTTLILILMSISFNTKAMPIVEQVSFYGNTNGIGLINTLPDVISATTDTDPNLLGDIDFLFTNEWDLSNPGPLLDFGDYSLWATINGTQIFDYSTNTNGSALMIMTVFFVNNLTFDSLEGIMNMDFENFFNTTGGSYTATVYSVPGGNFFPNVVPEPSILMLFFIGGIGFLARKRKKLFV